MLNRNNRTILGRSTLPKNVSNSIQRIPSKRIIQTPIVNINRKINIKEQSYTFFENIIKNTKDKNQIVFGPIVSEMGWELLISGFIRKFKLDNPTKLIKVITRSNRISFYKDIFKSDDIITFDIASDYLDSKPSTNKLIDNNINKNLFTNIKNNIINNYPNIYFVDFQTLKFSGSCPVDIKNNDYNYKVIDINNIVEKYKKNFKEIVTIFPRNRKDLPDRNWGEDNWNLMYNLLSLNYPKTLFVIAGLSNSVVINENKEYKNIINLSDILEKDSDNVHDLLELTILFLRNSKFSTGSITFGSLLTLLENIPHCYIGAYDNTVMMNDTYNIHNTVVSNIKPASTKTGYNLSINKFYDFYKSFYNNLDTKIDNNIIMTKEDNINIADDNVLSWYNKETDYFHFKSWDGVGDTWWLINKVKDFNCKYMLHIYAHKVSLNANKVKSRSSHILEMLNVPYTIEDGDSVIVNNIHKKIFNKNNTLNNILSDIKNKNVCMSLLPNLYMESGSNLQDFWNSDKEFSYIKLNKNNYNTNILNILNESKDVIDEINNKTVFIHPATYGKNKNGWCDLNEDLILRLCNHLHKNGYNIGLIGGSYDNIIWDDIISKIKNVTGSNPVLLVDKHLAVCMEGLKKAKAWIGPINGLSIVALTQQIPVCAFWPKHLNKMISTIKTDKTPYIGIIKEYNSGNINNDIISKIDKWLMEY